MKKNKGAKKVTKEELQKLRTKYGFYSLKKEPFLYENNEELGFVYTYKHPFYGFLTRCFLPTSLKDAEDFLSNFSWYKRKGLKSQIEIVFDNYEKKNPKITFQKDGTEVSKEEQKDIDQSLKKKNFEKEQEKKWIYKLKRTIYILLNVIEEKFKIQTITYQNLVNLTNEYIEKQNELRTLMTEYDKTPKRILNKIKIEQEDVSFKEELELLKKEIENTEEKDSLEENIYSLVEYLETLELEEGLLKNKYELIKIPLQIDITKEKIKYIKERETEKKKKLRKKIKFEEIFKEIEEKSSLSKIVTYEHFQENEKNRIEEKYSVIKDLDIRTIGDYFLEFDNIKMEEPKIKEPKENKEQEISYEKLMKDLEQSFLKRPKKEQDLLTEIFYFLKNIVHDNEEKFKKNIETFINLMHNPNNIMIKVKYFKNIDITSVEKCLNSIKKEIDKLKEIEETILKRDCNVFFKGAKEITTNILKVSPKRILAPIEKEQTINYLGVLKEGTPVLFLKEEIVLDKLQDDVLELEQEKPYLLISLEKNTIRKENKDIIKIGKYREIVKEDIVVDIIKEKNNLYQNVIIERK